MKIKHAWLLRLYPQVWRARYGEEFLALLEDCPPSAGMMADVALGALDARLHLDTVTGRIVPFMNRLRITEITVFCAYIGFVVAGLAFGKMVEYDDFHELLDSNGGVAASYYTLYAGAFTALLAVLVGGLPIAYAAARYAIGTKRWRLLALFAVPPVSFVVWVGYTLLAVNQHLGLTARLLGGRIVGAGLFFLLFALAAIASPAAIAIIVQRSQISERLFHFARLPAIITALAMLVMLGATTAYGFVARAANPELFAENQGLLASNTTLTWVGILAGMALTTLVALVALIRGLPARPDGASVSQPVASPIGH